MWGGAAIAAAIAVASIGAPREGSRRVLVAVNAEAERRLATRLEGQTNDLDVDVVVSSVGPDLAPAQLAAAARAEAKARKAEIAVWFVSEGDGWLVHVSRGERTFRRLVSVANGALSSSATIEAVAVAVRTAVLGLSTDEDVVEKPPAPASPPTPLRFLGELSWTAALDRSGSGGHHGVEARLGLGVGAWRFTLGLEEHPPESIAVTQATIHLERQAAALSVGYGAGLDSRWWPGGSLGAELIRFSRVTTSVTSNLIGTVPNSTWSFAVRPELDLGLRLIGPLWAFFHVGADVLFAPPTFALEAVSGTRQPLIALWSLEPRASLGLAIDLE